MQFDVRIESGPNFEFQTTLTRDVEAEVDLRLRGSPIRPVLLGSISVNQGEIQVFGNRYTVDRGDIRFLNPVRIEPTFDMDIETKARGIIVNISFSGTMQKLNVNYSSDPPLQSREIIALLAVGRNPANGSSTSPAELDANSTTGLQAGGGLLGDAISAQLSSSIQRFFGASRVKIDPTVTGVDNLPQARLTVEQQISKEITLTYITNLNRTQEQLVQFEYDFSAHWSAMAVRQDNGLFGIDFQYRKRFK
jgi:translocation and assembly module TamB